MLHVISAFCNAKQPRVLTDLFSSMLLNAFVLYKLHHLANHKDLGAGYSSLDFIEDWLSEIAPFENDSGSDSGSSAASPDENHDVIPRKDRRRKFWNSDEGKALRLDGRFHCLQHAGNVYVKNEIVDGRNKRNDLRRLCRYCGERALYFCDVCNVPLCVGDCCKKFHTERKLPPLK